MERSKYLILITAFIICSSIIKANYKQEIYYAYINNNMAEWKNIIDDMSQQKHKSNEFVLELLNYQYGYIAWCIGNDKDYLASEYLNLAEINIEKLEKCYYKLSIIDSYKSAFIGYRIGLNKLLAPFIGSKSIEYANLAVKLDANNPFGFIQFGNIQYFMPSIFGGSKILAIEYFKKAERIMELNPNEIKNDWNYLNLITTLAKAYTEIKDYNTAHTYYAKIIQIEPNFSWVRNNLYSQTSNRIKSNI